jgi:tetratricopeptide (TPR) repeat protein
MGRDDLAELQWRKVVSEMPDYRPGRRGLVESLLKLGRRETAAIEIERLLASDTLRGSGLLLAASLAEQRGELAEAKQDLLAAILDQPDDPEPLEALCKFLFDHGTPAEAKAALEQLTARLPNDGAVLHNLGAVNTRLGDFAAAVTAYRASLDVRSNSAATRGELSLALAALGRSGDSEVAREISQPDVSAPAAPAVCAT